MDANASGDGVFGRGRHAKMAHRGPSPKHATEVNIGGGIGYDSGKIYASTGYGELLALDAGQRQNPVAPDAGLSDPYRAGDRRRAGCRGRAERPAADL